MKNNIEINFYRISKNILVFEPPNIIIKGVTNLKEQMRICTSLSIMELSSREEQFLHYTYWFIKVYPNYRTDVVQNLNHNTFCLFLLFQFQNELLTHHLSNVTQIKYNLSYIYIYIYIYITLLRSYFLFCTKEKMSVYKCDFSGYSEKALHCVLYFPNSKMT